MKDMIAETIETLKSYTLINKKTSINNAILNIYEKDG